MTTGYVVQRAQAGDAALLQQLVVRAFSEYEGRLDPPSGATRETVPSIAGKLRDGGAFVCRQGEVAVGCVFFEPMEDHLYIGRLAVPPEHRKRGIGDLLLDAAERHAAQIPLPCIRLKVRLVLEELHAYYGARGYVQIGLHSHDGYAQPTQVEMEKRL